MPFRINKPSSSVIEQSVPGNAKVEVYQPTASECQVEPVQANASENKTEPVQTDPTQLHATTYSEDIQREYDGTVVPISISTVTATSTQLTAGQYYFISNIDCWVKQGGSGVTVTTGNGYWVPAGAERPIYFSSGKDYLAAITDGGTGTLWITPEE